MSPARDLTALPLGILFAVGLGISGMTQPTKVIGFLDFGGAWDPTLAFVMGGAVGTYFVLYRWILRRPAALFGRGFELPKKTAIDARLVIGATLFGFGWGICGYCPGPAFTSLGSGSRPAMIVSGSILVGILLHLAAARWLGARVGRTPRTPEPPSPSGPRPIRPAS